jgi:addiction module HigA family antidote
MAEDRPIVRERRPRDPGYLLGQYYLEPRGITVTRFAQATGLTRKHVSNIIHGHAAVTPETAMRFALVLGTGPELWLNLQNAVDLFDARQRLQSNPTVEAGAFALPAAE